MTLEQYTEMQSFEGASGKIYVYRVTQIRLNDFPKEQGNYMFAKPTRWGYEPIYIGETENFKTRLTVSHEKLPCVKSHGGAYILLDINQDERARLDEETDLRQAYDPPCNRQ